jgi:hypothetical protein
MGPTDPDSDLDPQHCISNSQKVMIKLEPTSDPRTQAGTIYRHNQTLSDDCFLSKVYWSTDRTDNQSRGHAGPLGTQAEGHQ